VINRRPKLIATDLDGTIVPHNTPISKRTIDAFLKAHEMGVEVFFVTGRPPRWMGEIKDAFGMGSAICCNGGMLYDLVNEKVLEEWLMQPDALRETVDKLRIAIPNISFAVESTSFFHREKAYIPRWDVGMDDVGVESIDEVIDKPALKLLARLSQQELTSDQMLEIALKEVSEIATVTHSDPQNSLLEISAFGVSKGETLARIAERMGITADECVSFGDNPNDFSMLQWCGRSYAMADGHVDGPKYAKDVAIAHGDDGVAIIIEQLLQLPV
jgi:Cof subfamily protein (haloacid dehalogenase superfamily)